MIGNTAAARLLLGLVLLCPPLQAAAAGGDDDEDASGLLLDQTPEAELAGFKTLIASGDVRQVKIGCRDLAFTGITDVELFDQIERVVLRDYETTRAQGTLVESIPACIRALASSGNPKYHELVVSSVDRKPDRGAFWKYARANMARSIAVLERFPAWNAIISDTGTAIAGEPWGVTRIRNMLRAEDPLLVKEGVKRARNAAPRYPALYDQVEQVLLTELAAADSPERLDNAAWFCKLLGESGNRKYVATLQTVAAKATSEKVRRHAERVLERLAGES